MVWQHDATGTDPDGLGTARDMADADRCGGAGDASEVVVFGEPEALVSGGFGVSGQVQGVVQGVGWRKPFTDIGEVEDGEIYHIDNLPRAPAVTSG